jgi:hypothetical protein
MKKIIITAALLGIYNLSDAQNEKYIATMEKNIAILDTTRNAAILQNEANTFERISNAEKAEWLPGYYAAYCYVNMTYSPKADVDTWCDKAETFLRKADSISPNNSEIVTLKAQIASARISVSPMTRGQKYGTMAGELREKAKKLDPTNPRPVYLDGTAFFYTPAMFGGGKDKAKPSFEKALSMYDTFKPASTIAPHWGKGSAEYFLKQCDEKK